MVFSGGSPPPNQTVMNATGNIQPQQLTLIDIAECLGIPRLSIKVLAYKQAHKHEPTAFVDLSISLGEAKPIFVRRCPYTIRKTTRRTSRWVTLTPLSEVTIEELNDHVVAVTRFRHVRIVEESMEQSVPYV